MRTVKAFFLNCEVELSFCEFRKILYTWLQFLSFLEIDKRFEEESSNLKHQDGKLTYIRDDIPSRVTVGEISC